MVKIKWWGGAWFLLLYFYWRKILTSGIREMVNWGVSQSQNTKFCSRNGRAEGRTGGAHAEAFYDCSRKRRTLLTLRGFRSRDCSMSRQSFWLTVNCNFLHSSTLRDQIKSNTVRLTVECKLCMTTTYIEKFGSSRHTLLAGCVTGRLQWL